jgi:hypothetical protein
MALRFSPTSAITEPVLTLPKVCKELLLHSPARGGPIPFKFPIIVSVICLSSLLDNFLTFGHNINLWVEETEAHTELFGNGTIMGLKS